MTGRRKQVGQPELNCLVQHLHTYFPLPLLDEVYKSIVMEELSTEELPTTTLVEMFLGGVECYLNQRHLTVLEQTLEKLSATCECKLTKLAIRVWARQWARQWNFPSIEPWRVVYRLAIQTIVQVKTKSQQARKEALTCLSKLPRDVWADQKADYEVLGLSLASLLLSTEATEPLIPAKLASQVHKVTRKLQRQPPFQAVQTSLERSDDVLAN